MTSRQGGQMSGSPESDELVAAAEDLAPGNLIDDARGEGATRSYASAAANETLEEYSLRYAPVSFRTWTPFVVASTAIGGIAYLADFAIGASIVLTNGA